MKESNVVYYSLATTQRENFLDRMTGEVRKTLLNLPGVVPLLFLSRLHLVWRLSKRRLPQVHFHILSLRKGCKLEEGKNVEERLSRG